MFHEQASVPKIYEEIKLEAIRLVEESDKPVTQVARELGIRVAVGADRSAVVKMVLREGLQLALIGTALGLAGAALAAQLIRSMLYSARALDPLTFLGVPLILILVATLAVYLPARRAASRSVRSVHSSAAVERCAPLGSRRDRLRADGRRRLTPGRRVRRLGGIAQSACWPRALAPGHLEVPWKSM